MYIFIIILFIGKRTVFKKQSIPNHTMGTQWRNQRLCNQAVEWFGQRLHAKKVSLTIMV